MHFNTIKTVNPTFLAPHGKHPHRRTPAAPLSRSDFQRIVAEMLG